MLRGIVGLQLEKVVGFSHSSRAILLLRFPASFLLRRLFILELGVSLLGDLHLWLFFIGHF